MALSTRLPWMTPEYFLWSMTIGRAMLYLQYIAEANKPPEERGQLTSDKMTAAQLRAKKEQLRAEFPELQRKYGDIDDG